MTRKKFVELNGATCSNWIFSWSFINESEKLIIFGAWDSCTTDTTVLILSEDWKINSKGNQSKGYKQSREHVRMIEQDGYRLMTFPMQYTEDEEGVAKIKGFTPVLTEKNLIRLGNSWYASDADIAVQLPLAEELLTTEKYTEGTRYNVTINAYERNPQARLACMARHGCKCAVCGFDFVAIYGDIGKGYIHVHHLIPVAQITEEYQIDPAMDLIPVCPNCHAMIHRVSPILTVEKLREHVLVLKTTQCTPNQT